jgi:arginyl-tRNA synthetase
MPFPLIPFLTQSLYTAIDRARQAGKLGSLRDITQMEQVRLLVEVPNDTTYGDYASPTALSMAKLCRQSPSEIAKTIAEMIVIEHVDITVAGPGYINFRLQPRFLDQALQHLLHLGEHYGKTTPTKSERILMEFVSANPTGPLHVGHGRWAAVGSTLANLLTWAGHEVEREFYINDAGNQMQILGYSLQTRVRQLQALQKGESPDAFALPEEAYHGSYLVSLAERLLERVNQGECELPTTLAEFTDYAYQEILSWQKQTLQRFQTYFDHWFSERTLHYLNPETNQSAIQQVLHLLEDQGCLYRAKAPLQEDPKPEAEEALYFKTVAYGDDKDRVVQKADGSLSYLAADIAYHYNKIQRGYNRLINIIGADHHGYVARLKAGVAAFSQTVELEMIVGQFVRLFKTDPTTGERLEVRMSKRTGNFVSVDDLIEDEEIGVGVDAARWFLLSTSMDTTINFDLDLARKATFDNPVVYAQYSHARCCTLLRRMAEERQVDISSSFSIVDPEGNLLFQEPQERILLMRLLTLPDELKRAGEDRAPHRIVYFVEALAAELNRFYDYCMIYPLLDSNLPLAMARVQLVKAARQVLDTVLTQILGITAPRSM